MSEQLLSSIVVGSFGEAQLLDGWLERERYGETGVHYTACGCVGRLRVARKDGASRVALLLSAPVGLLGKPALGQVSIGRKAWRFRIEADLWVVRRLPLVSKGEADLTIELRARQTVIPDRILNNGDHRALGLFLGAVWQE